MLNVALHPLDHPDLESCSRKSAHARSAFSPDSAISYFDYFLDVESHLTVTVHTVLNQVLLLVPTVVRKSNFLFHIGNYYKLNPPSSNADHKSPPLIQVT